MHFLKLKLLMYLFVVSVSSNRSETNFFVFREISKFSFKKLKKYLQTFKWPKISWKIVNTCGFPPEISRWIGKKCFQAIRRLVTEAGQILNLGFFWYIFQFLHLLFRFQNECMSLLSQANPTKKNFESIFFFLVKIWHEVS